MEYTKNLYQIFNKDVPEEYTIYRSLDILIFLNHNKYLRYHIVIVPLCSCKNLSDLPVYLYMKLFTVVKIIIQRLNLTGNKYDYTIKSNDFTTDQVYLNLLPRVQGDLTNQDHIHHSKTLIINEFNYVHSHIEKVIEMRRILKEVISYI